ncbi:hypothetical protein [Burkholderia cepacia]|nr:hypothetical protein [Burkholderia cepacia]
MNYRTKNRLGLAVVVFLALVIVVAAAQNDAIGTATSTLGHLHAQ